jgi:hypothetical protein
MNFYQIIYFIVIISIILLETVAYRRGTIIKLIFERETRPPPRKIIIIE